MKKQIVFSILVLSTIIYSSFTFLPHKQSRPVNDNLFYLSQGGGSTTKVSFVPVNFWGLNGNMTNFLPAPQGRGNRSPCVVYLNNKCWF